MMTNAPIVVLLALSARTVTLDEAVRAAEAQKPEVRVAQANAAAGVARTVQARAPALPQIKVEGEYDRTTGNRRQRPGRDTLVSNSWNFYNWFEGQVTGTQLIWDFGKTLNSWRAAEMRAVALADTERATRLEAVGTVRVRVLPGARGQGADRRRQPDAGQPGAPPGADHRVRAGGHAPGDRSRAVTRDQRQRARRRHPDGERLHRRARPAEPGDGRRGRHRLRRRRRRLPAGAGRDGPARRRSSTRRSGRAPIWRRSIDGCRRRSWRRAPRAAATGRR